LTQFDELEKKGMLPEEFEIPDKDFNLDDPLYIFQDKQLQSSLSRARNRPVREEFEAEPQLKPELKPERKPELGLEPATSKE
jgi:hypothetical protein